MCRFLKGGYFGGVSAVVDGPRARVGRGRGGVKSIKFACRKLVTKIEKIQWDDPDGKQAWLDYCREEG